MRGCVPPAWWMASTTRSRARCLVRRRARCAPARQRCAIRAPMPRLAPVRALSCSVGRKDRSCQASRTSGVWSSTTTFPDVPSIRNRSPVLIAVSHPGVMTHGSRALGHDRAVAHMSADIDDNATRGDEQGDPARIVVARQGSPRARRRRPVVEDDTRCPSTTPGFTPTPAIGPVSGARWLSGWIGAGTPTHASGSVVAFNSARRCRRSATSVHVCGSVRHELVEREVRCPASVSRADPHDQRSAMLSAPSTAIR